MAHIGSPGRTAGRIGLAAAAILPAAAAVAAVKHFEGEGKQTMTVKDERSRIAHLLRRAGFGASPSELNAAVSHGYDATLHQLLYPSDDHDVADDTLSQLSFDLTKLEDAQRWWLVRMRYTSRPLAEKMTLFWHGHFATSVSKVGVRNLSLMRQQNDLLRAQAFGNFQDLLLAISRDPAMLIWLDGRQNHRNAPNENYGRELMELFTMGIGNYSEDDVKAAAHAFTGWSINRDFQYVFNAKDHDDGTKALLGQSGPFNGEDIVGILARQPATANFLASKLARFFVSDPPDQALVASLANTYMSSNFDIRSVLMTLFKSDAFSSDAAYHSLIKSPVEFTVGTLRTLDIPTSGDGLPAATRSMGQELFNPPNVAGWPAGESWIATNTMLARDNLANSIAVATKPESGYLANIQQLLNLPQAATSSDLVNGLSRLLVDADLTADEQKRLYQYLGSNSGDPLDMTKQDLKVRGVLYLMLSTPEYSLS